ncbi:MAG: GDP-mannose 4,6-dehydratase [Actinomycetota bacterium]|nr:GDP-mannose 4,6-dehydratase [Actinomycetota bacterium]
MSKRVVVTGVAGFIGSHLAEALIDRGDTVVGLDDFNEYYSSARKRSNLDEVSKVAGTSGRFQFLECDIRDRKTVDRLFREREIDAVAHLAAMPGVRASLDDPYLYYDVNLAGTTSLLDAAVGRATSAPRERLPVFVFASTSSVYGADSPIPFVEISPCDRPLAPYPASKRAGEMIGHTYHHVYGLDFTALRFFTVYGPRNRPDMMAFKVADSIRCGREVPLHNGGDMRRDWTFVGDIVRGVTSAIDRPLGYEVVNLGRGEPVNLNDFVATIEGRLGTTAKLVDRPMPATDMRETYADISKARRLLDYAPGTTLEEGVRRFLDWYDGVSVSDGA